MTAIEHKYANGQVGIQKSLTIKKEMTEDVNVKDKQDIKALIIK